MFAAAWTSTTYSFKYYYYDKDGNFLISITLKPEDYQ